jgi:hypothetical protein
MRVSRDYRIEILFANVDVEQKKELREAIMLTDYAKRSEQKLLTSPPSAQTTPASVPVPGYDLDRLFDLMGQQKSGASISGEDMKRRIDVGKPREMVMKPTMKEERETPSSAKETKQPADGGAALRLQGLKARHARQEARRALAEAKMAPRRVPGPEPVVPSK